MNEEEVIKILIVGEFDVGKTSILCKFNDDDLSKELQYHYCSKRLQYDNDKILNCEIWDIPQQAKTYPLPKIFYKDTNAVILVYDITRKDTYEDIKYYWLEQIKENTPPETILVFAANKSDLIDHSTVDEEEARRFAENLGAIFVSTTVTKKDTINNLLIQIAKKYTGCYDILIKEEEYEEYISQENIKRISFQRERQREYPKCDIY